MRWLVLLALALVLVPGVAPAGTGEDPELVDAAGDAVNPISGESYPFVDVTAVWIDELRADDGTTVALVFHIRTVEPATPETWFELEWGIDAGEHGSCGAELWLVNEGTVDASSSTLDYWCDGDEGVVTVLDLARIRIGPDNEVRAGYDRVGNEVIARVPVSAFTEGGSASLYRPGTMIEWLSVDGWAAVAAPFEGIEGAPGCRLTEIKKILASDCGPARAYTIGS